MSENCASTRPTVIAGDPGAPTTTSLKVSCGCGSRVKPMSPVMATGAPSASLVTACMRSR